MISISLVAKLKTIGPTAFTRDSVCFLHLFNLSSARGQYLGKPANEANTTALKNTNAILPQHEEAEESSIANVSLHTMTQDQCFDNGHRASSSKDQSSATNDDQVSDDLDSSKNSVASNVVNSVQEFNVDVNSRRGEHRTDNDGEAIVRNSPVDSDSPSTGEVLSKSDPPSVYACSKQNSDNLVSAIDVSQSECANNISLPDMTVVTHQNSSENIREIIANSDQVNKFPNDTRQLPGIENNVKSVRVPATERVSKKRIAKKSTGDSVDKDEDPIVRLNKLRASISSALSEVKGVLRQYSTEQSIDGESESTPSSQDKKDDGPVRFRFVRKIRRKSAFSEDDETPIPEHTPDVTAGAIIANETAKSEVVPKDKNDQQIDVDLSAAPKENNVASSGENKDKYPDSASRPDAIAQHDAEVCSSQGLKDQVSAIGVAMVSSDSSVLQTKQTESTTDAVNKLQQKTPPSEDSAEVSSTSPVVKTKIVKTKKVVKKDRRASIAAVEINQAPTDKLLPKLDLKAQRRPSDSGTVVKETVRVKIKSSGKPKLPPGPAKTKAGPNATASDHMQSIKEDQSAAKLKTIPTVKIVDETAVKVEKVTVDNKPKSVKSETPATAKIDTEKAVDIPSNHATESTPTAKVAHETSLKEDKAVDTQPSPEEASAMKPDLVSKAETKNDIKAPTSGNLKQSTTPGVPAAPINEKPSGPSIEKQTASNVEKPSEKPTTPNSQNPSAFNSEKQNPPSSEKPTAPSCEKKCEKPAAPGNEKPTAPNSEKQNSVNIVNQTPPSSEKPTAPNYDTKLAVVNPVKTEAAKVISANNQLISTNSNKPLTTNGIVAETKTVQITPPSINLEKAAPAELNGPTPAPTPVDTPPEAAKAEASKKPTLVHQKNVVEPEDDTTPSTNTTTIESAAEPVQPPPPPPPAKKKRKAKRKVVIRRIKRKLSKDDTFIHTQEAPAELEICEKEIEEKDVDEEPEEEAEQLPKQPKPCIKARTFEIGDTVMYAERYRKTQVKWRKGTVIERITSISYKLNLGEGEEVPAHISYIKKFTDRKVNFGGKEYLEIDYAQIEEDEEKERNYSIWNLV